MTPVCTSEITTGDPARSPPDPGDELVPPGRAALRRVRLVVRGDARLRPLPLALRHGLQPQHGAPQLRDPDPVRAARRRRAADRLHAVSDLPRPDPPRGRPRGPAEGFRQRGASSTTRSGGRRSSSTASSTPRGRSTPSRRSPARPPATPTRPPPAASSSPRTSTTSCSSRSPTTTTTPTATGPTGLRSRSRSPTTPSPSSSTPTAASTTSSPTTRSIVVSDHAQSAVDQPLDLPAELGRHWQVLQPNAELSPDDELAVGPSGRGRRRLGARPRPRRGRPRGARRRGPRPPRARGRGRRPGRLARARRPKRRRLGPRPRRRHASFASVPTPTEPSPTAAASPGRSTETRTRSAAASSTACSSPTTTPTRSPGSGRRCATRTPPTSSSASPPTGSAWTGEEATTCPGGSHGSLLATDSLGTLLTVGLDGERPEREQWAISDVFGLIEGHFGLAEAAEPAGATEVRSS